MEGGSFAFLAGPMYLNTKYHSARVLGAYWGRVYVARPIAADLRSRESQYLNGELTYIQADEYKNEILAR